MRCPFCREEDAKVIDSRSIDDGYTIRRRRECSRCGRRFTTHEAVEHLPLMVIKNDGRRELFSRDKLLTGLIRSCDKRNISLERIMALATDIETDIMSSNMEREIASRTIGELVMNRLKDFDQVAYIRFASVYRQFTDISSFREELEALLNSRKTNQNAGEKEEE